MKKILSVIMLLLLTLTLFAGCKDDKQKSDDSFKVSKGELSADVYLLDSWKNEIGENDRDYYVSLLLYSDTYYAFLNNDCVKYMQDGSYEKLTSVFSDSEIKILDLNSKKSGTKAVALIKTKKMIDTKKIYVLMDGPAVYEDGIMSIEDFKSKHGNEPTKSEWATSLCTQSSKSVPFSKIEFDYDKNVGAFGFLDDINQYVYYEQTGAPQIQEDKAFITLQLTYLTNTSDESVKNNMQDYLAAANIKNNEIENCELNDNLEFYFELTNNILSIGYKTKDRTNINTIIDSVPKYVSYSGNTGVISVFKVK